MSVIAPFLFEETTMTFITHNARGKEVRVEEHVIGNRILRLRSQLVYGQWVQFARSSHPIEIHSLTREAHAARH